MVWSDIEQLVPPLGSGCKVQRLTGHAPLKPNSSWVWRIDEIPASTDYNAAFAKMAAIWTLTVRTAM
jgi:hypothetical protein